jgi:hypothetical protein
MTRKHSTTFTFSLFCALLMPLGARAATVPGGAALWVRTLDEVSSSDKAGKQFAGRLDSDLVVKGKRVAPAGTKVYGRVESSRSAGRAFGQSKLALSLTQIVIGGRPVTIATGNYEESGPRSSRKTVARTAAGAAVGAAFGGPAAGDAVDNAVRAQALDVAKQLKATDPIISDRFQSGKLAILAAYYDLDTGKVELLKP